MFRCKTCHGTNIQVAVWARPNKKWEIVAEEPIFNINQAPSNVCVQWCDDCDEEVELEEPIGMAPNGNAIFGSPAIEEDDAT